MEHKDDDDDDDVSFAKWMSSFWGHSWREEDERGLRECQRPQDANYRKTSLPYPFPALPRTTSDYTPRRHSQAEGFRRQAHIPGSRKCSVDGAFKEPLDLKERSPTKIQEFSESFEQQLCIKTKRSVSLGPESRKDKNERECLRMEIRSHKKVGKGRSSMKKEHQETYIASVAEEGPE